eukprot:11163564-Lingulodinium_polyedra.AAC.1
MEHGFAHHNSNVGQPQSGEGQDKIWRMSREGVYVGRGKAHIRSRQGLDKVWRRSGEGLEKVWRRSGESLEKVWRRSGEGLEK